MQQLLYHSMMLQGVERSLRYLKSDLGIRPICHYLEARNDADLHLDPRELSRILVLCM